MRSRTVTILTLVLAGLGGCTAGRIMAPGKGSFSITTIDRNYFNVMLRFNPVAEDLKRELKEPVAVLSDWNVRSIKVHLSEKKSYYDLLYVDPVDYWRINETAKLTPLAVRVNAAGETSEVGLIVVAKKSPIRTLGDLKGKRFAFGPYESPYLFYNALELFKTQELPVALLKGVSYNKDSLAVAQKVLMNWSEAGVVTRSWWQTTTDRTLDLSKLLKDDLRVIGQTAPMPDSVWAVTAAVSDSQKAKIEKVLTRTLAGKQQVLTGFAAQGFKPVAPKEMDAACKRLEMIKNIPLPPLMLPLPLPLPLP